MVFAYSPSSPSTSYATSAMEIPTSSSRPRSLSPSCAYPSWPQGSSMGRNASQSTSFIISDEELFPSVFDEDARDCTPPYTPHASRSPASPACLYEPRIDNGSFLARALLAQEKSKRDQQQRRRKACKKSRSSSSNKHMSPIVE